MSSSDSRRADQRGALPWSVVRHIPIGVAVALSAMIAALFVWPALSEANRLDARAAELERGVRGAARIDALIAELTARRDAAEAELATGQRPLPAAIASRFVESKDGRKVLKTESSFEEITSILGAIDHASGLTWLEFHVARGSSPTAVALELHLAEVDAATRAAEVQP